MTTPVPPANHAAPQQLHLRPATTHDVPVVTALAHRLFVVEMSAKLLKETFTLAVLKPNSYCFWLAETEVYGVVGYVLVQHTAPDADVISIGVAPSLQGQGIGRLLLATALEQVAQQGVAQVFLEVRQSNLQAQKMYLSLGARQVGRRKGYYHTATGPREDALLLSIPLAASPPATA